MKKILKFFLILFLIFILVICGVASYMMLGQNKVLSETPEGIDLSGIEDGTYLGTYNEYRWDTTVEVTVLNHKITSIVFIDDQDIANINVSSYVIDNVILKQTTKIDAFAGATISSTSYLKSIEDALID